MDKERIKDAFLAFTELIEDGIQPYQLLKNLIKSQNNSDYIGFRDGMETLNDKELGILAGQIRGRLDVLEQIKIAVREGMIEEAKTKKKEDEE